MSTTNEPRYQAQNRCIVDMHENKVLTAVEYADDAQPMCDLLNKGEQAQQLNRELIKQRDMLRGATIGLEDVIAELQSELDAYKAAEKRLFDAIALPPSAKIRVPRVPKDTEAQS